MNHIACDIKIKSLQERIAALEGALRDIEIHSKPPFGPSLQWMNYCNDVANKALNGGGS